MKMISLKKICKSKKGASLLSYGILIGLIAVVVIVSINSVGRSVRDLFTFTAGKMENAANGNISEEGGSGGVGTPTSNTAPHLILSNNIDAGLGGQSGQDVTADILALFTDDEGNTPLEITLGANADGICVTSLSYNSGSVTIDTAAITCTGSFDVVVADSLGGATVFTNITVTVTAPICVSGQDTFSYTGSDQSFTVPAGCTTITVRLWGAGGGGGDQGDGAHIIAYSGGGGGFAHADILTTPGDNLTIRVGGGGSGGVGGGNTSTAFGGGGRGSTRGGGGGGLSAIYLGSAISANALVTAGAGGGGAAKNNVYSDSFSGGAGGGSIGGTDASSIINGLGGTSSAGGAIGSHDAAFDFPTAGSAQQGGHAPISSGAGDITSYGGGGGSGFFGGGGGGTFGGRVGGGGGGSNGFSGSTSPITDGQAIGATPAGIGDPFYISGVGVGGTPGFTTGNAGGNGYVVITY